MGASFTWRIAQDRYCNIYVAGCAATNENRFALGAGAQFQRLH